MRRSGGAPRTGGDIVSSIWKHIAVINAFEVTIQMEDKWTSAGVKSHFSYDKLIDMFENSIIMPHEAFVIGLDYRIPIVHGLLDRAYVNKLKMSPSFNAESFAREYKLMYSINY